MEPDAVPVQKEFEQFDGIRIPLDFAANYGGKFDRDVSPEIVVLFGLSERERIGVAELILAEIESIGEHVQRKSERRKGGVFFVPAVEDSDRSGKFSNKLSLLLGPEIASALVSVPTYSDFVNDDLLGFLGEPKTLCVGEEDGVVVIYHGGGDCVEFSCLDYTAVYQNRPPPDWIRFLDP
ncbi:MAG: hypothetical protein R3F19_19870 [Verrucomicrobiales bacterium]